MSETKSGFTGAVLFACPKGYQYRAFDEGNIVGGEEKKRAKAPKKKERILFDPSCTEKQTKGTEATGGKNQSEKSTTGQGFVAFYFYWLFRYGSIQIGNEQ